MCGNSTQTPDTAPAAAVQQQQYAASNDLANEQLKQQQAQFDKQYAAEQANAAAQLQQSQAEAQRQSETQAQALAQAQAQYQAVQDQQRQAQADQLAQAQAESTRQRDYATGRQDLASQYTDKVNSQYAGFDDPYFAGFAQHLVDTYAPQVQTGYDQAARDTKFAFNDAGTLDSSAAARSFGQLAGEKTAADANLASSATDQANSLKANANAQKGQTLSSLLGSLTVGNPLPAGSDPAQALSGLRSNADATLTAAGAPQVTTNPTYTPPGFSVATPKAKASAFGYVSGLN